MYPRFRNDCRIVRSITWLGVLWVCWRFNRLFFFSRAVVKDSDKNRFPRQLSPEVMQALRGVRFIAQHIKDADNDNEVSGYTSWWHISIWFGEYSPSSRVQIVEDWKFVSMVLDRFLLWVFTLSCIGGTLLIICQSPSLYDTRTTVDQQLSELTQRKNNFMLPKDIVRTTLDD